MYTIYCIDKPSEDLLVSMFGTSFIWIGHSVTPTSSSRSGVIVHDIVGIQETTIFSTTELLARTDKHIYLYDHSKVNYFLQQ